MRPFASVCSEFRSLEEQATLDLGFKRELFQLMEPEMTTQMTWVQNIVGGDNLPLSPTTVRENYVIS